MATARTREWWDPVKGIFDVVKAMDENGGHKSKADQWLQNRMKIRVTEWRAVWDLVLELCEPGYEPDRDMVKALFKLDDANEYIIPQLANKKDWCHTSMFIHLFFILVCMCDSTVKNPITQPPPQLQVFLNDPKSVHLMKYYPLKSNDGIDRKVKKLVGETKLKKVKALDRRCPVFLPPPVPISAPPTPPQAPQPEMTGPTVEQLQVDAFELFTMIYPPTMAKEDRQYFFQVFVKWSTAFTQGIFRPSQARRYLRSLLQHMANGGKYDRSAQWCKIWIEIDRPHDPHLEVGMYVVTLSTTTPSILTVLTKSCADGPVEGHQINMSFTELEDGTLIPVFYPNESSQGVCFLDALQALIDEGYRLETLVSIGGQINPKENKKVGKDKVLYKRRLVNGNANTLLPGSPNVPIEKPSPVVNEAMSGVDAMVTVGGSIMHDRID